MIIGISASGRRNRIVEQTVRAILEETAGKIMKSYLLRIKQSTAVQDVSDV